MPTPFALYCLVASVVLMAGGLEWASGFALALGGIFEFAVFASAGVVPDDEGSTSPTDAELGIDDGTR